MRDGSGGAGTLGIDKRGDQARTSETALEQSTLKHKSRKALAIICLAMKDLRWSSAIGAYDA